MEWNRIERTRSKSETQTEQMLTYAYGCLGFAFICLFKSHKKKTCLEPMKPAESKSCAMLQLKQVFTWKFFFSPD